MRYGLVLLMLMAASGLASSSPDEARGVVTGVIDGATINVDGVGRVCLADVRVPGTPRESASAFEYTYINLLNRQVFLDIDEASKSSSGCKASVVYFANSNGTANEEKIFNRMIVDSGNAWVSDDKGNEFDPGSWWASSVALQP